MKREPQLIVTGGTLSATRNAHGHLAPSAGGLDGMAAEAGFTSPLRPYVIDSIDFDIGLHYPLLRDCAFKLLREGRTAVIAGGTDTLIWYATLLTRDAMRHGFLTQGSGQKLIFLTAMRSLEDAPGLVRAMLRAGMLMAQDTRLSGGYALSARDMQGSIIDAHDACRDFDKISARLIDALRSRLPAAYIHNDALHVTPAYTPLPQPVAHAGTYARIAPPLLRGNHPAVIRACIAALHPHYDALLIEGMPEDTDALTNIIQSSHAQIIFCNPVRYDNSSQSMQALYSEEAWQSTITHADALRRTGARFATGIPKDMYLEQMLAPPPRSSNPAPTTTDSARHEVIALRYVPDCGIMQSAIALLAPLAKNLLFSALPGSVMPDALLPALKAGAAHTHYWSSFEYTGNAYVDFDGTAFIESAKNSYAAGQQTAALVRPYK